mmetsp:Transcript_16501/g.35756  ORF Transcript_16501/g.35756 Transcript_16501/m.35756 type:complete len:274 (+) Transcript_16501:33-854(+)
MKRKNGTLDCLLQFALEHFNTRAEAHVNLTVADFDDHSTENVGVDAGGEKNLLVLLDELLKGSADVGNILFGQGVRSGHHGLHLATMGAHDLLESIDDLVQLVGAAIVSKSAKEVLGDRRKLGLIGQLDHASDTCAALDGRVVAEVSHSGKAVHKNLELLELHFNIGSLSGLGSGTVESCRIASGHAVDDQRDLHLAVLDFGLNPVHLDNGRLGLLGIVQSVSLPLLPSGVSATLVSVDLGAELRERVEFWELLRGFGAGAQLGRQSTSGIRR